jgi:hypothetical protein
MSETNSNLPTVKLERHARRNVAIAGPVHTTFVRTCNALKRAGEKVDQQTVVTELVSGWNRKNARRAKHQLLREAADMNV